MKNFNDIQRLIFASALENNPDIIQIKNQINDKRREIKSSTKSSKPVELKKLAALEKNFDKTIEEKSGASLLDETFIERVETFLNTFSPDRLNFRLAPFDEHNDFQILAKLKSEYLVNGDFENVIYTYGSRPNIKLSIFGIITSSPQKEDQRVDLNDEYVGYDEGDIPPEVVFEKAFRGVFSSFEGLEKFFFVPIYPKIAVSPIAIYREVQIK